MFVIVLLFSHVKTDILLIGTNFDSMYSLSYQHVMARWSFLYRVCMHAPYISVLVPLKML